MALGLDVGRGGRTEAIVLSRLPDDRLLGLRYEDFFIDSRKQQDTLPAFIGEEFVDEDWAMDPV